MAKRLKAWARWEDELMRGFYPDTLNCDIARALGRSEKSIGARAFKLGLRKTKAFILLHTQATQFKKGQAPANKGRKMPYNANCARTQFKKGNLPHNTAPVGTEVVDREGYRKRKVSDRRDIPSRRNWVYVHRLLWEQHNGPVPAGHLVTFRDGDRTNIVIENLALMTKGQNAKRNHDRYPPEIHRLEQLVGALNRRINRIERERKERDGK